MTPLDTTITRKTSNLRWVSNTQSQQASGRRRLRPRGNWDRPFSVIEVDKYCHVLFAISGLEPLEWNR
jgi:hypothetical protein